MMRSKAIQIRDAATNIPAVAMKFGPGKERIDPLTMQESRIAKRAGFSDLSNFVFIFRLSDMAINFDPNKWGENRSMVVAHFALAERLNPERCGSMGLKYDRGQEFAFHKIVSGQVVDVEYMLGLTEKVKEFE